MARVPIEEGYFRIPDDPDAPPVLLGSKCPNCGEVFFPRRMVCAKCLYEGTDDVDLSTRGTLWTWTYCEIPLFGKKDTDVPGLRRGPGRPPRGTAHPGHPARRVPTTSRSAWSSSSTSRS